MVTYFNATLTFTPGLNHFSQSSTLKKKNKAISNLFTFDDTCNLQTLHINNLNKIYCQQIWCKKYLNETSNAFN